jgi:glycosyltransferase involved in cell wall biosynthesis
VQSARRPDVAPAPPPSEAERFEVVVLGHLRAVKDPFRAALASAGLPPASRVRVRHAGGALDPGSAEDARTIEARCPRWRWLGELPRQTSLELLAASHLMVLSSRLEGGANVVAEAVACGVPVLSTRIDGSIGQLGADHPGYFPTGDTEALAALLARAERDRAFYADLVDRTRALAPRFTPERERAAIATLLDELLSGA